MDKQTEEQIKELANRDTPLKSLIVDYIGSKLQPDNGEVTVEMCVEVFSQEFPEFLLLLAQENFLRGYQQSLDDMEAINNETKSHKTLQKI